jgi:hypothetical protein
MLATEADIVRTLAEGTYTLNELYRLCSAGADTARERGDEPPDADHLTDRRWKRRVRGALQSLKASACAERIGRATWVIRGTRERPRRMILVAAGTDPEHFELRLQDTLELLAELDEPADLLIADPPYGLGRGTAESSAERVYQRDRTKVVGGYVDVDPNDYEQFTFNWVAAAAAALRPAGQLAVVTGPQAAAVVQYASEKSGLRWVSSIAARRWFALRTTRRPACAHWTVTVMCRGPVESARRVFNPPADLPKARSGVAYPLDWWDDNGRSDRPGLMRYDNSLPERLAQRLVETFSDRGELVCVPFLGGGSIAVAAWKTRRRFVGADINAHALRFTAARLLDEHAWPTHAAPALFAA